MRSRTLMVLSLVATCLTVPVTVGAQQAGVPRPHVSPETHELASSGLFFPSDDRLAVESEEIVMGRSAVRVTYSVPNRSPSRIVRVVSWPLPDLDPAAVGDATVTLPAADSANFLAGRVTVDGADVPLALEQRASALARDVTALIERHGLPLNPLAAGAEEALRRIPPAALAELEEQGVVSRDDDRIAPVWTLRTTAFWRQTYEPDRPVTIALAYTPVTAAMAWSADGVAAARAAYCIDKPLEEAIAALARKRGRGLVAYRLTYSVAHHPGWSAPIPDFRLALEKTGFETLIATCRNGLQVVGPTRIEWPQRDFRPDDDIRVLFIQ